MGVKINTPRRKLSLSFADIWSSHEHIKKGILSLDYISVVRFHAI